MKITTITNHVSYDKAENEYCVRLFLSWDLTWKYIGSTRNGLWCFTDTTDQLLVFVSSDEYKKEQMTKTRFWLAKNRGFHPDKKDNHDYSMIFGFEFDGPIDIDAISAKMMIELALEQ